MRFFTPEQLWVGNKERIGEANGTVKWRFIITSFRSDFETTEKLIKTWNVYCPERISWSASIYDVFLWVENATHILEHDNRSWNLHMKASFLDDVVGEGFLTKLTKMPARER